SPSCVPTVSRVSTGCWRASAWSRASRRPRPVCCYPRSSSREDHVPPLHQLLGRLRQLPRNMGVFVALDEKRYARQASRQMLELYWLEHREHPELSGRALYTAVVARGLGAGGGGGGGGGQRRRGDMHH